MGDIVSFTVKDFKYRVPFSSVDENGELGILYDSNSSLNISDVTFLYCVIYDSDGSVLKVDGVDQANAFIMHKIVNCMAKNTSTYSSALIQYFSFLEVKGVNWQLMPYRRSLRPTYMFKAYLEAAYRNPDKDQHLAAKTCKSYMCVVVDFYRFHIKHGKEFQHSPFEDESLIKFIDSDEKFMHRSRKLSVKSSDLRLSVPSEQAGVTPKKLISLNKTEWDTLDKILRVTRRFSFNYKGKCCNGSIPIEFSLLFLLMRFTGIRREEAITFNTLLIEKPTNEQLKKRFMFLNIGPRFGVETKFGKEREIEIPSFLMNKLHEYTISRRYSERRRLYLQKFGSALPDHTPLFLNEVGEKYANDTINARWGEIRNTASALLGYKFIRTPHNLRATYAVFRLFALLDSGAEQSNALTYIQVRLGHTDLKDTFHYLRQTQGAKSSDELAELALEYLLDIEEGRLVL